VGSVLVSTRCSSHRAELPLINCHYRGPSFGVHSVFQPPRWATVDQLSLSWAQFWCPLGVPATALSYRWSTFIVVGPVLVSTRFSCHRAELPLINFHCRGPSSFLTTTFRVTFFDRECETQYGLNFLSRYNTLWLSEFITAWSWRKTRSVESKTKVNTKSKFVLAHVGI
jgi:hypothetical protein